MRRERSSGCGRSAASKILSIGAARLPEERHAIERLRAITSQVIPSALPWRMPEHRELLLSGLRLADPSSGEGSSR